MSLSRPQSTAEPTRRPTQFSKSSSMRSSLAGLNLRICIKCKSKSHPNYQMSCKRISNWKNRIRILSRWLMSWYILRNCTWPSSRSASRQWTAMEISSNRFKLRTIWSKTWLGRFSSRKRREPISLLKTWRSPTKFWIHKWSFSNSKFKIWVWRRRSGKSRSSCRSNRKKCLHHLQSWTLISQRMMMTQTILTLETTTSQCLQWLRTFLSKLKMVSQQSLNRAHRNISSQSRVNHILRKQVYK